MFANSKTFGRGFAPHLNTRKPKPALQESERQTPPTLRRQISKNPDFDLKAHYPRNMERALIAALALMLLAFYSARELRYGVKTVENAAIKIEVAEIPPTEQIKRPPPPPRPSVALPTEAEDVPDDATIASTDLNLLDLPPPPPPTAEVEENFGEFVAYDEPPEIIGGMAALLAALDYPTLARKAGIEGTVIIGVEVDEQGNTRRTKILKEQGANAGLEEAAIKAVKQMKWKPAYQRDKPIKVWISIPVRFRLT